MNRLPAVFGGVLILSAAVGCGSESTGTPSILVRMSARDVADVVAASTVLEVVGAPDAPLTNAAGEEVPAGSLGGDSGAYLEDRLGDDGALELIVPVDLDAAGSTLPTVELFVGSQPDLTFVFEAQGFDARGELVVTSGRSASVGFPDAGQTSVSIPDVASLGGGDDTPTPGEGTPTFPPDTCDDDIDNDLDGWFDFTDPDCYNEGNQEGGFGDGECNDGTDNDGDGQTDARDPDCELPSDPELAESTPTAVLGPCEDGTDGDLDGWIDEADPDCAEVGRERGFGTALCNNSIDDDLDGLTDTLDPDCLAATDIEGDGVILPTPTPTEIGPTPTAGWPPRARFYTLCDVQEQVFDPSCASCHNSGRAEAGLDLSPGKTYAATVGVASTQLPSMPLVTAGDWERSYLLHKMRDTHRDVGGSGDLMPDGGPVLSDSVIEIVYGWIEYGALESCDATPPPTPTPTATQPPTPTMPVATPTEPGATPTESGATPTAPGATPTAPGATPTEPGATPTESGATPTPPLPTDPDATPVDPPTPTAANPTVTPPPPGTPVGTPIDMSCTDDDECVDRCGPQANGCVCHLDQALGENRCTATCDVTEDCNGGGFQCVDHVCEPGGDPGQGGGPTFDLVLPDSGPLVAPGNQLRLVGTNLGTATHVRFDGEDVAFTLDAQTGHLVINIGQGAQLGWVAIDIDLPAATLTKAQGYRFTGSNHSFDEVYLLTPLSLTATLGGRTAGPVNGEVELFGTTNLGGQGSGILCEVGWGPQGSNPSQDGGWLWSPTDYDGEGAGGDLYTGIMPVFVPGTWSYTFRCSMDGGLNYGYADVSGVSDGFDPDHVGTLTVTP